MFCPDGAVAEHSALTAAPAPTFTLPSPLPPRFGVTIAGWTVGGDPSMPQEARAAPGTRSASAATVASGQCHLQSFCQHFMRAMGPPRQSRTPTCNRHAPDAFMNVVKNRTKPSWIPGLVGDTGPGAAEPRASNGACGGAFRITGIENPSVDAWTKLPRETRSDVEHQRSVPSSSSPRGGTLVGGDGRWSRDELTPRTRTRRAASQGKIYARPLRNRGPHRPRRTCTRPDPAHGGGEDALRDGLARGPHPE